MAAISATITETSKRPSTALPNQNSPNPSSQPTPSSSQKKQQQLNRPHKSVSDVSHPPNRKRLSQEEYDSMTQCFKIYTINGERHQRLPNGNYLNWDSGILCQVKHLLSDYEDWIEHPHRGQIRMMQTDFFEGFTYTKWYCVPLFYTPWSLLELRLGISLFPPQMLPFCLLLYVLGFCFFTFFEYMLHRFVFHWIPTDCTYYLFHFLSHGLHHLTPDDEERLVFPLAISLPLGLIIRTCFYALLPAQIASLTVGGFILGYVGYESTHYLSHHCPTGEFLRNRYKYHSQHHFSPLKKNALFGVTSQFWDIAFGTM